MPYTIAKQFTFAASHHLEGLPSGHRCAALHGHNYVVEVQLYAVEVQRKTGMVRDFGDLDDLGAFIRQHLDHAHLNTVLESDIGGPSPTAENLAYWLYQKAVLLYPETVAVKVWETPTCWAEYRVEACQCS